MKTKVIHIPRNIATKVYTDALLHSYYHRCDIFSAEKQHNRDRTDKSFLESLEACLSAKFPILTAKFRPKLDEGDFEHYEFAIAANDDFFEIRVRCDLAEMIFEKYKLEIREY